MLIRAVITSLPLDDPLPPLFELEELRVDLATPHGPRRVVDGVSLQVAAGETLGVVGESGSGKSTTLLGALRLLPATVTGSARFRGVDLLRLAPAELRRYRGAKVGVVFQDPTASLDPTWRVGQLIEEAIAAHRPVRGPERRERAVELLARVGIPDPVLRARAYPHELSGGMRQRVAIALALAGDPELLIADEPTSSLDVTVQAQIVDLLRRIQRERGLAIVWVSHDLPLVAELCDRVAVMAAGRLIETGPPRDVLAR